SGNVAAGVPLTHGRNRHLQIIDGLPFGDDIKQGLIRGQRFVHPDLRFEFTVPKKFTLKNAPDRVTATHKNGMELLFDLAGRKEAQRPVDYIRNDWAPRGSQVDVSALTVAGRPAALGKLRRGGKYIELLVVEYSLSQVMRFALISPANLSGNAQSAMQTVRRGVKLLSAAQAARIKPDRIRVITVQPGDTLESLSRNMATDERRQDLLLALNNLQKPVTLKPGMRLKLVVN
ncbi:MAG: LysM peptidoglycan-binding domain-containing protein, partial [Pseudomonadota bacterium]|nr:LysM peptidoglycan-binding domain-containing protein [Pseudomonadota bacterium]